MWSSGRGQRSSPSTQLISACIICSLICPQLPSPRWNNSAGSVQISALCGLAHRYIHLDTYIFSKQLNAKLLDRGEAAGARAQTARKQTGRRDLLIWIPDGGQKFHRKARRGDATSRRISIDPTLWNTSVSSLGMCRSGNITWYIVISRYFYWFQRLTGRHVLNYLYENLCWSNSTSQPKQQPF